MLNLIIAKAVGFQRKSLQTETQNLNTYHTPCLKQISQKKSSQMKINIIDTKINIMNTNTYIIQTKMKTINRKVKIIYIRVKIIYIGVKIIYIEVKIIQIEVKIILRELLIILRELKIIHTESIIMTATNIKCTIQWIYNQLVFFFIKIIKLNSQIRNTKKKKAILLSLK